MTASLAGKRLLVLGAYASEVEIVRQAQAMGVYVIVTDNHEDWRDAPAKYAADEAWDVSWSDTGALLERCAERPVDGVIAGFSERRVACAQRLASALGLPFYADGAKLDVILRKDAFRSACESAGVAVPRSYSVGDAEPPVIVKPVDNGGSRGITVCRDRGEVEAACLRAASFSDAGAVVIEDYIVADEAMVYYVVHDGVATLSAMCDRYMHSFDPGITQLPVGYLFPSRHLALFEGEHDERFRRLISDLGIANGLIAFQCFVKNGEVIPFDPTYRLDGTMAYRATEAVNGTSALEMLIRMSLTGSMGEAAAIEARETPHFPKTCFELPVLLGRGRVGTVEGEEAVRSVDGVYFVDWKVAVGDVMKERAGFSQMACRVQLTADGEESLRARLSEVYAAVRVLDEYGDDMVIYREPRALACGEVSR
ncbi:carbamoyl-phosphate-synthetase [Adlercreutzia sp. ZJ242]|uniref:carbamoyl-phosphate-synthetase n=1 Tax=Adlercreutzia sp. ZJ242 TaxID=2709409 RepID=UPI0013EDB4B2|nr:carbamoyl-phosphate-synthetase [Adlercreutzia sp. ZJ242]